MEDDDEFGDLYTDVLQPFQSSSTPPIQPPPVSRGIDLNDKIPSDDEEILFGVNNSSNLKGDQPQLKLNLNKIDEPRVLMKLDLNLLDNDNKEDDENFGIEEADVDGDGDGEEDFLIPGLSSSGVVKVPVSERGGGGGDEWDDSDSEDDLQIVLNDDNLGVGMMGIDGGGLGGEDDDDDEDGDNLVIVTGNGDQSLQQMEEMQDWGEEGGQGGEERKDLVGDAGKGDAVAQKVGYPGHGYHSFHSQFKVRYVNCCIKV